MKFDIRPELFDNFIDGVCIVNSEMIPVYMNPSFLGLFKGESAEEISKLKISDSLQIDGFDWDQVRQGTLAPLESQAKDILYKFKNHTGHLKISWKSIQLNNGKLLVALNVKDISYEAELVKSHNEQMILKNQQITVLDEHIFQISLIKDVLERATTNDDPLVMLRDVFSNLSQIFLVDHILYLKEDEINTAPVFKTCGAPGRINLHQAHDHAKAISPELIMSDLSNNFINNLYWVSYQYKDDSDLRRYFIFGKPTKFKAKEQNLIEMLCEPLNFSLDYRELFKKAITDELTEIYNHRYFKLRLHKEIRAHGESKKKLGLLILAIDFLNKINDTYGHLVGDIVLTAAATCLKNFCRATDIPSRYCGAEFAVILREVDETQMFNLGERLRKCMEDMNIQVPGHDKPLKITVSIGICVYPTNTKIPLELIALAEKCLYEAKRTGSNKCIVAETI